MTRRHGRRRHRVSCDCRLKSACFTTYSAAMAAVVVTPDAERPYRGTCCGHYHITRYSIDEYAQLIAARITEGEQDELRTGRSEPQAGTGGPGPQAVERRGEARSAPTPATLARFLEGRRDQGL